MCALTSAARRQILELEPDERSQVLRVLGHLSGADHVRELGYPIGESPSGEVWRLRFAHLGVFLALDEDDILVVGFAARRGGWGW